MSTTTITAPLNESLSKLEIQIMTPEKKIDEQSTKITDLHDDRMLLLQEN